MSASTVEFRALGPVEIAVDGRSQAAYGAKQRTLLALLLLDVNRVAERDWLIDQLWAGDPPNAAHAALRAYAYRLRKHLDLISGGATLQGRTGGYLLEVEPAAVDVHRFETLSAQGRQALQDGTFANARTAFQKGLDLWRGPAAFAGIDVPAVRDRARRLDELRLEVTEQYWGAALESGPSGGAVSELEALTATHPLREGLWRLLMLGLYRDGRQGEALEAYQRLYRLLDEELGIGPSTPIERLHQQILAGDPQLQRRTADQAVSATAPRPEKVSDRLVPKQLPASTPYFTGRAPQLAELHELLPAGNAAADRPAAATVAVLTGTAGIGKTALAVHWAHQVADRFPDGQLYVNLRGFDPAEQPTAPPRAVRAFLDTLGMPPAKIPADLDSQAALYRSLLADKRVLVILDNARDVEQVRPLLPGGSGSLVVVTSRNQLTGLITQGAQPIRLTQLDADDAGRFLTRRLRRQRTATEPEAVQQIIDWCAGLPLALAIVAARATTAPHFPLAVLSAELRDASDRLDALADPDPAVDVRAVFSWSYRALSAETARLFRLLSAHPGPDIAAAAVASLLERTPQQAQRLLTELTRANLLVEQTPGRYAFHDLLRAYASELADSEGPQDDRAEATQRMLDFYLHNAYRASQLIAPIQDPIQLVPARSAVAPAFADDAEAATAWFAAERSVLPALIDHADQHGFDSHCWQLSWAVHLYLHRLGLWHDLAAIGETSLEAARRLGDTAAQTRGLRVLANVYTSLARFEDADALLEEALKLSRGANDQVGQAHIHQTRATMWASQGRFGDAIACNRNALDLFTATSHLEGQARALTALGWHYAKTGEHQEALDHCERAMTVLETVGDRYGQAAVWDSLGLIHHDLGRYAEAIDHYRRALDLCRELGLPTWEAEALESIGDNHLATGDRAAAARSWRRALAVYEDLDHPQSERTRAKLGGLE